MYTIEIIFADGRELKQLYAACSLSEAAAQAEIDFPNAEGFIF